MMNRSCPRPSTLAGPRAIVQAGRWSSPPPPAHHLNRVFPGPEPPNHAQQPTVYRCTQVGLPTRDPRATTPLTADHLHGHGDVPQMVQLVIGVPRVPAPCTPNHFLGLRLERWLVPGRPEAPADCGEMPVMPCSAAQAAPSKSASSRVERYSH